MVWTDRLKLDVHPGSVVRGIRAMDCLGNPRARWWFEWGRWRSAWVVAWTPAWHDGRGPYLSVGLFVCRFGRGY